MIDNLALALGHGLLLLAAWRLLSRDDLDDDLVAAPEPGAGRPFRKPRRKAAAEGDSAGA